MPGGAPLTPGRPIPDRARAHRALLLPAVLGVLLAACGTPVVQVSDVPSPEPQEVRDCTALSADLPDKIGKGLEKRTVEPSSPLLAAWGKPAVVLRCGVGTPASYRPGVDLDVVNNIGWYADERADDIVYTTITREPRVALAVPRSVGSSFEILVDLSEAISKHTTGPDLTSQ